MLLHLGGDRSVFMRDVVAVVALSAGGTPLQPGWEDLPRVDMARDCGLPAKSCAVVCRRGVTTLYLSPISVQTLILRMQRGDRPPAERNQP